MVEVVVAIGVIAVLISILLPTISTLRQHALRAKCSNNLRNIAMAMISYSQSEVDNSFPRTIYNPNQRLQLDNAGYLVPSTFGRSGYVGDNNVPASLFLLMKTQGLSPKLFICPATDGEAGFANTTPNISSNWEQIPRNMSYSLSTPFPSPAAVLAGFKWKNSLGANFPLLADINPGTRGGANPPNNVVSPPHTASIRDMAAANSNNHGNKGQNVVYGDCHVEFQTTPYCGMYRDGGFRDNIYTAGNGDGGVCDDTALPVDEKDAVMLPTDDPGGK